MRAACGPSPSSEGRLWRWMAPALLAALAAPAQAGLCESGRRQSPVDIVQPRRQALPALAFDYQSAPLKIAHDGHTARVRLPPGSVLRIGSRRYTLQQLHFHTPGGDRIAGEEFPMAAHLLHKDAAGQLLALVVLMRLGPNQPLLDRLLPHLPTQRGGDHGVPGVAVNPLDLLPAGRGYFRYSGSLTAAPCTEGVDWIVLREPVTVSARQLAQWKRVFSDNARPVQPLHGRIVLESD